MIECLVNHCERPATDDVPWIDPDDNPWAEDQELDTPMACQQCRLAMLSVGWVVRNEIENSVIA